MDDITASQDLLLMSDKIFSVLTILLVIFGGLIGYLFFTNKKIGALEAKIDALDKE